MSLVIFGAGGFGPSVFDIAQRLSNQGDLSIKPMGFLDDNLGAKERIERLGVPLLGSASSPPVDLQATHYAISVASPARRRELAATALKMGLLPATLVHPAAWFCPDTKVGPGAIICAGVNVDSFTSIGSHAIINKNGIVGHDTSMGSFVTVSPMSVIGGGSRIGDGVMIGMTATINPQTSIGEGAYVASGSAVISSVAPNSLVAGVPAKFKKSLEEW